MVTVVLGIAALLVWVGFELVFRAPGEASRLHGDRRDRASTPLLVMAFGTEYRAYAGGTARLFPGIY